MNFRGVGIKFRFKVAVRLLVIIFLATFVFWRAQLHSGLQEIQNAEAGRVNQAYFFQRMIWDVEDKSSDNSRKAASIDQVHYWKHHTFIGRVHSINCRALLEGDPTEKSIAKFYSSNHKRRAPKDQLFLELTSNCHDFKLRRGYVLSPASPEEAKFPVAYSILFYKELYQLERLLRVIYQPQNFYCIHLDGYASDLLYLAAKSLTRCFDNVFLVQRREKIIYAGVSRLQADINCMSELVSKSQKWKYFINLASQDFPLKTNAEIVKVLNIYNGSNDVEGMVSRVLKGRFSKVWQTVKKKGRYKPYLNKTEKPKDRPPHGLNIVRGSAYGVFSRAFTEFVLSNRVAKDLLEWSRDTYSPDEHYWATLNHLGENPFLKTPGGYTGDPDKKRWLAVYASWGRADVDPCFSGRFVRGVCILGIDDLPALITRDELFANKFYLYYQYLAMDCIEEWLYNKTINPPVFDSYAYRRLSFINGQPLVQPTRKPKTSKNKKVDQSKDLKKSKESRNVQKNPTLLLQKRSLDEKRGGLKNDLMAVGNVQENKKPAIKKKIQVKIDPNMKAIFGGKEVKIRLKESNEIQDEPMGRGLDYYLGKNKNND